MRLNGGGGVSLQRHIFLSILLLPACLGAETALSLPDEASRSALRGFNWGHLTLLPSYKYDLTYTDNSTRTQNTATEDLLHELRPKVDLRFKPSELIDLQCDYELGWHDYTKDTARDYLSHHVTTLLEVRNMLRDGFGLSAGNTYVQSGDTSALENELLAFSRYQSNESFVRAGYRYNRFSLSGQYTYNTIDYFARINAFNDIVTHSGLMEGGYDVLPARMKIMGLIKVERTLRSVDDSSDFDTNTLQVGVAGKFSKLDYALRAGYTVAETLHVSDREEGPAFEAKLQYRASSRMTFSGEAARRFVPSINQGIATETLARLAATLALTRRGDFRAEAGYNQSDRLVGVDLRSFAYSGAFEYKVTRFATATLGYTRTERETSTGLGGFTINEARIGFRLAW